MNSDTRKISAVPTNIITGFLGVGKTSAILNLLEQKPADERWAILVNEFGEIGVDGSLFEGQSTQDNQIFIREVPGGCMCCTAGLPMQIALNQLLTRANPDRLLIEPTGLGHPREVLEVLSAEHYHDVISLQKIITLVDARKLADPRYTEHDTFNQQIGIADLVVGNKTDLYRDSDKVALIGYVKEKGLAEAEVTFSEHGKISLEQLVGNTLTTSPHSHHHHHAHDQKPLASELPLPECGFLRASNEGEGFESVGWRFSPEKQFNYEKLFSFLSGITAERMKAVFITEKGIFGYNLTSDALTEIEINDCVESRIEIIAANVNTTWENDLMACTHEEG